MAGEPRRSTTALRTSHLRSYRRFKHHEIVIRSPDRTDAVAIAALSQELGYVVTAEQVVQRLAALETGSAAFVAFVDGEAVGWIHVHRTDLLQTAPFAEIGGLVVTAARRDLGVGRALMAAAERWAAANGLATIRLRSRLAREGAHRFYERLGYAAEKTSFTFRTQLPSSSPRAV